MDFCLLCVLDLDLMLPLVVFLVIFMLEFEITMCCVYP